METNNATEVTIYYSNGEVFLSTNGHIAGLQINYECTGNISLNGPPTWLFESNQNKIIMVSLDKTNIEDGAMIIQYNGDIKIKSAMISTWDLKSFSIQHHIHYNKSNFPNGAIYSVTDSINNAGGLTTIANSSKKIKNSKDSTYIQNLNLKNIKTGNLKEVEKKALEELGYNIDGVVIKRKTLNKKQINKIKTQLIKATAKVSSGGY